MYGPVVAPQRGNGGHDRGMGSPGTGPPLEQGIEAEIDHEIVVVLGRDQEDRGIKEGGALRPDVDATKTNVSGECK